MGGRGSSSRATTVTAAQAEANLRAYLGGDFEITTAREQAERRMTPAQRAEAQREAQRREQQVAESLARLNEGRSEKLVITTARERKSVRAAIDAMKAPKVGEGSQSFSYGGRSVTISKARPGWSGDGNRRAIYWVRNHDDHPSNAIDFSGPGGFQKAKKYAIEYLRLGD